MNTFQTIAQNVGVRVGDTSATFQNSIYAFITQRYRVLFAKFNFNTLNLSYSFNTVGGTQDYALPSDFYKELYVYDATNLRNISRLDFQELERIYSNTLQSQGSFWKYTIFQTAGASYVTDDSGNIVVDDSGNFIVDDANTNITNWLRLFEIPNSVCTIQIPYIRMNSLVNTTDLPIIELADLACELGATADAWRVKRQFQKASDFEGVPGMMGYNYEGIIATMIWNQENQPNRVSQFRPMAYYRDNLYNGDGSTYYYGY